MKKIYTIIFLVIIGFSAKAQGLDSLIMNGLNSYQNGDVETALVYYDSALVKYPQLPYLYVLKAEAIFNSGYATNQKLPVTDPAVYDAAKKLLDKALELSPKSADIYTSRGLLNTIHQKYELAIADYNKVLSNTFDFDKMFAALSDRASAYSRLQQYEQALSDYQRAIELKPNDLGVLVNMAAVHNDKGEPAKAEEILIGVLEKDSTYTYALNNLGMLKVEQEKYDEAKVFFQKSLIIESRDAVTLNNFGYSLGMSGEVEMGLSLINQSLKVYPANAYAYRNIGVIYLRNKKRKDACENFKKAQELNFKATYGDEIEKLLVEGKCK